MSKVRAAEIECEKRRPSAKRWLPSEEDDSTEDENEREARELNGNPKPKKPYEINKAHHRKRPNDNEGTITDQIQSGEAKQSEPDDEKAHVMVPVEPPAR